MDRLTKSAETQPELTEHERELGSDPKKGYIPREAECGKRLEEKVGPLRRDPSGAGDWIDGAGKVYDGMGPVPTEHLDQKEFGESLDWHLHGKQGIDVVAVDIKGLTPEQKVEIEKRIDVLPSADKERGMVLDSER
jgi:hypothetical protein